MPFYILPFSPFSALFCPLVSDADINLCAKHTSLFSFQFSLYMRCYNKKLLKNFVYNPSSSSYLIYNEEDVTDVADDITAEGLIELDIGHC